MQATIGRIVLYTLSADDVKQINRRRTNGGDIADRIKRNSENATHWPIGAQAHIGNAVEEGEVFPMMVTRVWSETSVNGQAFLDGNDCLWVTSASEGTGPHTWAWPQRS